MVPCLQCRMDSEPMFKVETLLHMQILLGPLDPMVYGLLLNMHATIK
jgi:hypothetical protein